MIDTKEAYDFFMKSIQEPFNMVAEHLIDNGWSLSEKEISSEMAWESWFDGANSYVLIENFYEDDRIRIVGDDPIVEQIESLLEDAYEIEIYGF